MPSTHPPRNVLVVGELQGNSLRQATLSAISCAHQIATPEGTVSLLLLSAEGTHACEGARTLPLAQVLCAEDPQFVHPLAECLTPTITAVAREGQFAAVVVAASTHGKDLAPHLAAQLQAGYASDITAVHADPAGRPLYQRSLYAGRVDGICALRTPMHVVSVRQSAFPPASPTESLCPVVRVPAAPPSPASKRIAYVRVEATRSERPDLGEARVVVAGGRALKEQFLPLLEPLAQVLQAAMGATRALCDGGYAPPELQIGQTGRMVAPFLYLAVGLSGAMQHVAGMQDSRVIVAINQDPDAPIMRLADYRLVADLFAAVPALVAELRKESL